MGDSVETAFDRWCHRKTESLENK